MSVQQENPSPNTEPGSAALGKALSQSGDTPAGLYWTFPLIVALVLAAPVVTIWLHLEQIHSWLDPLIWIVLLAAAIIQSLRHYRWDREQQRRRLYVLEALIKLSSFAGPEFGSMTKLYYHLPQALGVLLGMEKSLMCLLEEDQTIVHVVASEGLEESIDGQRFALAELPVTRLCVQKGYVVAVPDTRHPLVSINAKLAEKLHLGAMMQIPMVFQGEVIGIMVVASKRPRRITEMDVRRAWLWGCQGAVMLSNSRLYARMSQSLEEQQQLLGQTHDDAETKAMLLRELNHRVKNNLASIVSLLSINQPTLGPQARQWLNRAIDRINAMAQMHDLFSGGSRRVTLGELVERTVRSLSVAKPAGVAVRADLSAGGACLRTDRAVTLAMAMHELCFNGIVHGLGSGGDLIIRSKRDNGQLTIEVEDKGVVGRTPFAIESPAGSGSGIGLSLVRGLVGRELHGQFTLASTTDGAVARVQFPLLADELRDAA